MTSLDAAFRSYNKDLGSGEDNSFFQKDNLFILADAVGVEHLRETAKERACKAISESFFRHLSEKDQSTGNALVYALIEADKEITMEMDKLGERMAVSVSVAYFSDQTMYFSHLGDSRIYSFHEKELNQLTRDHTDFEEDHFSRSKTDDQHIMRGLTDGLGIHDKPTIKVNKYSLHKKELILMMTKGLTNRLSGSDLRMLAMNTNNPEKLCRSIIDLAKKNDDHNNINVNNINVSVLRFGKLSKNFRNILITYSAISLIILTVILSNVLKYRGRGPDTPFVAGETLSKEGKEILLARKVEPLKKEKFNSPPALVIEEDVPEKITPPIKVEPVGSVLVKAEEWQKEAELLYDIYVFTSEWKGAWEKMVGQNGDIASYISFYSDRFKSNGLTRDEWRHDKSNKGRKKSWMRIEISDINISGSTDDGLVEVRFDQRYSSSNYSGISKKLLILVKEMAGWKIVSERNSS